MKFMAILLCIIACWIVDIHGSRCRTESFKPNVTALEESVTLMHDIMMNLTAAIQSIQDKMDNTVTANTDAIQAIQENQNTTKLSDAVSANTEATANLESNLNTIIKIVTNNEKAVSANAAALAKKCDTSTCAAIQSATTKWGSSMNTISKSVTNNEKAVRAAEKSIQATKASLTKTIQSTSKLTNTVSANSAALAYKCAASTCTAIQSKANKLESKLDNKCDASTCSATQTNFEKLETCLGDINSNDCPPSKEGKISVIDAIQQNKEDIANIGDVCEESLCSSTDGCPVIRNTLLTTLPHLNKQFRVSFEFRANEFTSGNVIHFTEGGTGTVVGDRVPAFWFESTGKVSPRFAVNGNGNYGTTGPKKYSLHVWHYVEFSQSLINGKYIYKVVVNGEVIDGPVENKQPEIFSNVQVSAAYAISAFKGSIRNILVNTDSSKNICIDWVRSTTTSDNCDTVCKKRGKKCNRLSIKTATLDKSCSMLLKLFPERVCKLCTPNDSTNRFCFPGTQGVNNYVYHHKSFDDVRSYTCQTLPPTHQKVNFVCPCE